MIPTLLLAAIHGHFQELRGNLACAPIAHSGSCVPRRPGVHSLEAVGGLLVEQVKMIQVVREMVQFILLWACQTGIDWSRATRWKDNQYVKDY